jgi:hypothetical protein
MGATFHRTVAVQRIMDAAERAGLNPTFDERPYRGSVELHLDAKQGPDSPFGVVRIGVRTGRVLYAALVQGNEGVRQRFEGGRVCDDMLRAIRALPTGR